MASTPISPSGMAASMGSRGSRVRRIRSPTPALWKLLLVSSDDTYPTLEARDFIVTRCVTAQESIPILQEGAFDFVLVDADVDDGFKLVKHITKRTNVRVAMMSSRSDEEVKRKGFEKGACDFFVKPINIEDLRNCIIRGRPAVERGRTHGEADDPTVHAPPAKKRRVIWIPELHSKFVEAVDLLGITKAVPKKILEIMNEPDLTRENVASHLQKFRQHCKKQEEKSQKQATGVLIQGATFDPRPPSPIPLPMELISLMERPENRVFECGVGANQMPRAYSECRNLQQEHELQAFGGHAQSSFDDMGYDSLVASFNRNYQMTVADNADFYGQHHQYSVGTYGVDVYQPPSAQNPNNQLAVNPNNQLAVMGNLPEQSCVVNPPLFNAPWEDYGQGSQEFFTPQMQRNYDHSWFRPPCSTAADFKPEHQFDPPDTNANIICNYPCPADLKAEHQVDPPDTNTNTICKYPCPQVNQIPKSDQLNQIPKSDPSDPTNQYNGELQEFDYLDVAIGFDWSS